MAAVRARGLCGAIALAATLAGCASGPALRGGVYRDPDQRWVVAAPPPEWTRMEVEGANLAFRSPGGASLAFTSRCDGGGAPVEILARQLRIGLGPHELVEERGLELAGRPAVLQVIALPGARIRALTRAAPPCVQDFVLVAPGDFEAAARVFDAWWASFAPAAEGAR